MSTGAWDPLLCPSQQRIWAARVLSGEGEPSGCPQLCCCQLGELHLLASGPKQLAHEFLLLGAGRWGNGEKWVASPVAEAGCVKVPISCWWKEEEWLPGGAGTLSKSPAGRACRAGACWSARGGGGSGGKGPTSTSTALLLPPSLPGEREIVEPLARQKPNPNSTGAKQDLGMQSSGRASQAAANKPAAPRATGLIPR